MSEIDVAILARVKQGYIYKYMLANNLNQSELARRIGVGAAAMGRIINFKWRPIGGGGGRTFQQNQEIIKKLEQYFGFPVEVLFPPELTEEVAAILSKKHVSFKKIECLQLGQINPKYLAYDPEEGKNNIETINNLIKYLTPREETVIKKRFGIDCEPKTLHEIAGEMDFVSSERIRQIEAKALKKMRRRLLEKT